MGTSSDLISLLKEAEKKGTTGYDTQAEVLRVEGDTVWVNIPGGVPETPIQRTIDAKEGDTVQVRVAGGNAWLVGNASAPPTDDSTAIRVEKTVERVQAQAANLQEQINDMNIAGNENQYFWHTESGTDTGSHITEIPQDEFIANPSGFNVLIRSIGLAIRNALTELAQFTANYIRLGNSSGNHVEIDTDSVDIKSGNVTKATFGNPTRIGDDTRYFEIDTSAAVGGATFRFVSPDGYVKEGETSGRGYIESVNNNNSNRVGFDIFAKDGSGGKGYTKLSLDAANSLVNAASLILDFVSQSGNLVRPLDISRGGNGAAIFTTEGTLNHSGNVNMMTNNSKIQFARADASLADCLRFNGNNSLILGYGGYNESIGATYIDGNAVRIYSREDVTFITSDGTTSWNKVGSIITKEGSAINVANNSVRALCNFTLTPGRWVITGSAEFASNATGRRAVQLSTTNTGDAIDISCKAVSPAANGGASTINFTTIVDLTANQLYYLNGWQNSGGALSTKGYLKAIRIKG